MAPGRGGNHTATTARLNLNVANHYATLGADIEARGALQFGSGFSMGANGIYYDKALNDINAPTTLWGLAPGALFNGEVMVNYVTIEELRNLVKSNSLGAGKRDVTEGPDPPVGVKRSINFSQSYATPMKIPKRANVQMGMEKSKEELRAERAIELELRKTMAKNELAIQVKYREDCVKMIAFLVNECTATSQQMVLQDQEMLDAKEENDFVKFFYLLKK